jgi:hypothetical protein
MTESSASVSMKRPLGYLDGIGTGVAGVAMLGILWFASATRHVAGLYRDLAGEATLPAMTQLVLSTAWRVGAPLALAIALVAAHVWRPRYALVALAVVAVAITVFWYYAAYQPIFNVAGSIAP